MNVNVNFAHQPLQNQKNEIQNFTLEFSNMS